MCLYVTQKSLIIGSMKCFPTIRDLQGTYVLGWVMGNQLLTYNQLSGYCSFSLIWNRRGTLLHTPFNTYSTFDIPINLQIFQYNTTEADL